MTQTRPSNDPRPLRWLVGLLLFLLIAGPAAWLGSELHRAKQTEAIKAALLSRRCQVQTTESEGKFNIWLAQLLTLLGAGKPGQITAIFAGGPTLTDADLAVIKGLDELESLDLNGTDVTDAGLDNLADLSRLTDLSLDRTKVSDAGLAKLRSLRSLEDLSLNGTAVTDAGIEMLQKALPNVQVDCSP